MVGPDWLYHPLGVCSGGSTYVACRSYNFWSGVGSDLAYLAILLSMLAAAWRIYRKLRPHLECHEETCHRLGLHRAGPHFRTCWEHHPVLGAHPRGKVPLARIHAAHRDDEARRHRG